MKFRVLAVAVLALLLMPPAGFAEEFSLFGAKFGMSRAELKEVWSELPSGEYHIREAVLFNVSAEFDHLGRLYILHFSVPLGERYPADLTATAYQRLAGRMWGRDPKLNVSVRAGRGTAETTVSHKDFGEEYRQFIEDELARMFRP